MGENWSSVMVWAFMASSGTGLLVFIDVLCTDILSAQIQPNAAKLIGQRFNVHMDDDPKHTAKATQGLRR